MAVGSGHWGRMDASCALLFTELPLLERPAAAAAAGFTAIECWWPFTDAVPDDREVSRFVAAVRDAGVSLVALNFFAGSHASGDRGVLSHPRRASEFTDSVQVAVGIGRELGVPRFTALYGNRLPGLGREAQDAAALGQLAVAVDAAEAIGARVQLEPISDPVDHPLRSVADVVATLDRLQEQTGRTAWVLLDTFHVAAAGDDPVSVARAHGDRVGHVQLSDFPGRHEPGSANLDCDALFVALSARGYDGWYGLEFVPTTGTGPSLDLVSGLPAQLAAAHATPDLEDRP